MAAVGEMIARGARAVPAGVLGACVALLLLAGPLGAAADLAALTQKQLTAAEASLAKSQVRWQLLQDKLAQKEASAAAVQAQLAPLQAALLVAEQQLAAAQQQLAEALALPQGSPEEIALRAAAIAEAEQQLALAEAGHKSAASAAAGPAKVAAKLALQLAKLQVALDATDARIASLEDAIAALSGSFGFDSVRRLTLSLHVQDELGGPLPFVQVQVLDALVLPRKKDGSLLPYVLEDLGSPRRYAHGFTDGDGRLDLQLTLPRGHTAVDVLLASAGRRGPYSEDSLRAVWGPCAPAARLTVPVTDLQDVHVTLESLP